MGNVWALDSGSFPLEFCFGAFVSVMTRRAAPCGTTASAWVIPASSGSSPGLWSSGPQSPGVWCKLSFLEGQGPPRVLVPSPAPDTQYLSQVLDECCWVRGWRRHRGSTSGTLSQGLNRNSLLLGENNLKKQTKVENISHSVNILKKWIPILRHVALWCESASFSSVCVCSILTRKAGPMLLKKGSLIKKIYHSEGFCSDCRA